MWPFKKKEKEVWTLIKIIKYSQYKCWVYYSNYFNIYKLYESNLGNRKIESFQSTSLNKSEEQPIYQGILTAWKEGHISNEEVLKIKSLDLFK